MATALQNLIDAYIKRNANQEITGPVLNGVLTAISNALGTPFIGSDGYWYTYDAETGQFVKTDTPAQGETGPVGVTEAAATIDDQIGTPSVAVSLDGTRLDFAFRNLKGQKGDTGDAGITAAVVTVDAGIGTPSVDASITGTTLTLAFHNLKGETGAAAGFGTIEATVDDTTGTPAVVLTESGPDTAKNLSFAFSGLKGPKGDQGNTGVSADYPITIANNLTTDDPTAALAASQGVVLQDEIDQLGQEVNTLMGRYYGVFGLEEELPEDASTVGFAFVGGAEPMALWEFDGNEWKGTGIEISGITGPQGVGIDTIEQTSESTASEGQNIITITLSNGDTQTFTIRNGKQGERGPQGLQGNPGSSVDYPFTLENNLNSNDTTKALTAAMGKLLNDTKAGVSAASNVDLVIADESGNILAEFADGDFRVKNFNTKEINDNTVPKVSPINAVDFSISDPNGNILLILENGHIRTKLFNSANVPINAIKKAVFMGDSITQGVYSFWHNGGHAETDRYNGFDITNLASVSQATAYPGIHYYFGLMCGAEMVNLGKRGTGWVADTRNIGNALAAANSYDFSDVDFVALCFGVNDYIQGVTIGDIDTQASGTLVGNMCATIEKILTDNPLCKVVVYSPYNTWGQVSYGGDYTSNVLYGSESTNYALGHAIGGNTLQDIIDAETEVCDHYGIQIVDLSRSNVCNRFTIKEIMVDGLHPTKASYPKLAAEIYGKGNFGS